MVLLKSMVHYQGRAVLEVGKATREERMTGRRARDCGAEDRWKQVTKAERDQVAGLDWCNLTRVADSKVVTICLRLDMHTFYDIFPFHLLITRACNLFY